MVVPLPSVETLFLHILTNGYAASFGLRGTNWNIVWLLHSVEERAMADHSSDNQQAGTGSVGESSFSNVRDAAGQAFSKASEMARDAGEKAKRAAADTASTM